MTLSFFKKYSVALAACTTGFSCIPANAAITGSVNATMTLTSGCLINGSNTNDGGSATLGTVNFGSDTTLFTQSDATATGSGGGSITVQCSVGTSPTLMFNAGQNDTHATGTGSPVHAMTDGDNHYIGYNLYLQSGRTTPIAVGGAGPALPTDGSAATIALFGRAYGAAGLATGTYTDVVTVNLEL